MITWASVFSVCVSCSPTLPGAQSRVTTGPLCTVHLTVIRTTRAEHSAKSFTCSILFKPLYNPIVTSHFIDNKLRHREIKTLAQGQPAGKVVLYDGYPEMLNL